MGEFSKREIEIYDRIANLIGGEMVTIEFNIKDKSKLEFLLCSTLEEKQKVTKKKVKRFKKEIDNCSEEIAGYLLVLADIFDNGQYYLEQGNVTKSFISDYYDDLVQILVKENKDISDLYDLEDIITSNGYDYQLIVDYIFGVSNMYFYQYYKSLLDIPLDEPLSDEQIHLLNKKENTQKINATIQDYKKAIYSGYFEDCLKTMDEDGKPNMYYYSTLISNWRKQRSDEILQNPALFERIQLLQSYNNILSLLMKEIVGLFENIVKGVPNERLQNAIMNSINFKCDKISSSLDSIKNFAQIINHNINTNDFYLAIKIQNYCLLMFDDSVKLIEDQLFIRIHNSPLNEKFQSARKAIDDAIDFEKLKLLKELSESKLGEQTSISEAIGNSNEKSSNMSIDNSIVKNQVNPYPQVFSNVKSFQLFEKLFNQFKDGNSKMADFSFIYRKMVEDNYIFSHFKPQMFIEWVNKEPFKINLDKIKTLNECSTSQKINTYTTTKELIQIN
ncbi:hypothetical protein [Flavobacterium psychrotolerans]|uniref:Uncharacterized protein n=1 Tax=Flavobacterium psychrotolerans TaxID=2169410 RepID=A0A2U1JKK8_9FLAO|nr:hypothetical protein [Flavobacterium psychrotolerans]PWA05680.1 hypothetical protein DB895_06780 [Flavobacterium psychrotolerans]